MGLFNHFPYPDTHQLNLDWILDAVKTCVDKVTELWTYVREPGAGIQKALTDAQAAATSAQESVRDITTMFAKLYPVGSVYVNYRNQTMPVESDSKVIARLQALTGGTWVRAGNYGQPVTVTGKLGMATVKLTNDGGDYKETNFNIYVRTA
jgi:hypothetical protein